MTTYTLAQAFGDREVFVEPSIALVRHWFAPGDIIEIVGKEPPLTQSGPRPRIDSVRISADKYISNLSSESGHTILQQLCADKDLYFAVSPALKGTSGARINKAQVVCVHGVTLDLDVKDGAFSSEKQAVDFLNGLAIKPTAVVGTGSGGVHAYWKFSRPLTVSDGEAAIRSWWAYANEQATLKCGATIDRLVDCARMLRVPGSLRYPKQEGELVSQVTLISVTDTTIDPDRLLEVSRDASARRDEYVNSIKAKNREITSFTPTTVTAVNPDNIWAVAIQYENMEGWVNSISWDNILSPCGWTYLRLSADGSEQWARPGSTDKSAVVGWPESPNVMALHSTSADTGLSDLQEARVPLSKWRVILRLFFADDTTAMNSWVLENIS